MIRSLFIAALSLSSAIVVSVSAVNVPVTPSPVKRTGAPIPPTLLEDSPDLIARQTRCGAGQTSCGDGCCLAGYDCRFDGSTPTCYPAGETFSARTNGCPGSSSPVECGLHNTICCGTGQRCVKESGVFQCWPYVIPVGHTSIAHTLWKRVEHPTSVNTQSRQLYVPTTTVHHTTTTPHAANAASTPTHSNSMVFSFSLSSGGAGHAVVGSGILGMVALVTGAMIL